MDILTIKDIDKKVVETTDEYVYRHGRHIFTCDKGNKKVLHGTGRYVFRLNPASCRENFVLLLVDYINSGKNMN